MTVLYRAASAASRLSHSLILALTTVAMITLAGMPAFATDLKIGGIVIVKPAYEGSDRYEVVGAPFVFPVFGYDHDGDSIFSIHGLDDVRLRLLHYNGFQAGVLGGFTFGRDQSDGNLLRGLGDIDAGGIGGAYVSYRIHNTLFDASYHEIVGGHSAGYLRLGVEQTVRPSSHLTLKARIGVTIADDRYMDEYFGISRLQAARSVAGLRRYNAEAGAKDVHVGLQANYNITNRWTIIGQVGYKRLLGDAADSPIVETPDQFRALLGASYRFSLNQ